MVRSPMESEFASAVTSLLEPHLGRALARAPAGCTPAADPGPALGRFCAALARANEDINLTGIRDPRGMAVRHVLDALLALPACDVESPLVDLGSGCGVPGVPLALVLPGLRVTLVESRRRKAAALARLVDSLGLAPRVQTVHARGEVWLAQCGEPVTVITRAVGSVDDQLRLLRPVQDKLARLVMLKGPGVDAELARASRRQQSDRWPLPRRLDACLPDGQGQRVLLIFDLPRRDGQAPLNRSG